MNNYKDFIVLTAAKKGFVPATKRAENIKRATQGLQKRMQSVSKEIGHINESKGDPKLKKLRIDKAKALQTYIKAAIMLNDARVANLTHPD